MEKQQLIQFIAKAIDAAGQEALKYRDTDDVGTCNLDHVTIKLKGFKRSDIEKINELTSYSIDPDPYRSVYWKGHRPINFPIDGQATRRYKMIDAAYKSLRNSLNDLKDEEIYAGHYMQMD